VDTWSDGADRDAINTANEAVGRRITLLLQVFLSWKLLFRLRL